MTRLVDERGWSITGMPDDCGSSAIASFTRSCTRCRASISSVPILKRSTTCDSPNKDGGGDRQHREANFRARADNPTKHPTILPPCDFGKNRLKQNKTSDYCNKKLTILKNRAIPVPESYGNKLLFYL